MTEKGYFRLFTKPSTLAWIGEVALYKITERNEVILL